VASRGAPLSRAAATSNTSRSRFPLRWRRFLCTPSCCLFCSSCLLVFSVLDIRVALCVDASGRRAGRLATASSPVSSIARVFSPMYVPHSVAGWSCECVPCGVESLFLIVLHLPSACGLCVPGGRSARGLCVRVQLVIDGAQRRQLHPCRPCPRVKYDSRHQRLYGVNMKRPRFTTASLGAG
jgi:hypothetical protein